VNDFPTELTLLGIGGVLLALWWRKSKLGPVTGDGPAFAPTIARPGKYFSWDELTVTGSSMENIPDASQASNLVYLVSNVLDPLRERLGQPIIVTSGFRSPAVNAALTDAANDSQHLRGQAADILVSGLSSQQLAQEVAAAGLPFDKMIFYSEERGGHLHVSFNGAGNRRAILYAPPAGGYESLQA